MKSKEEIIETFRNDPFTGSINRSHAERCFEIADEYAKQQAIAFAKFTARNLWTVFGDDWTEYRNEDNPISSEQLYNLYLESKKQKV